jgi:diacylglycerol kinase family enzyme
VSSANYCVIYNPSAGRGRAARLVEQFRRARRDVELRPIPGPGQGTAVARQALADGRRRLIAAGGDGTVHEVANAILESNTFEAEFGVWPIGSANDYASALGVHGNWPLRLDAATPLHVETVDVGCVQGGGRRRFFVNGLGLGFNSAVTLEAHSIGRLRGMALYGTAFLQALRRHYHLWPLVVTVDDRRWDEPTLALTVNLGTREGGFRVTPQADLSDGYFNVIHVGDLSRAAALSMLPRIAVGRLPETHPEIHQVLSQQVTVQSQRPLRVHTDGEFFCHPADGICELKAELLPARLRVLVPGGPEPD